MKIVSVVKQGWMVSMLIMILPGCDDIVNVDTGSGDPILNVDAWVNNKPENQAISLTFTQRYFDNESLPPAASGASVTLTNQNGRVFVFDEDTKANDGTYRWMPQGGEVLGQPGDSFTLNVMYNGETFTATSAMRRVPAITDITFEKVDDDIPGADGDYYRAEFWAKDPEGTGDTYWIKTYKNGSFLNKASEINIAYDGAQSAGVNTDGVTFVTPIRLGINANDRDEDDRPISSLQTSDSIYVEIHSITNISFNYINEVITQTDRNGGLSELFTSTPLANVSTNIVNLFANGSGVVGFFNTAAVSGHGEKFNFD